MYILKRSKTYIHILTFITNFDLLEKLKEFASISEDLKVYREYLISQYSLADKKKVDIEHKIEFSEGVNACQGYKLFKKQQDILLERRKIKDELDLLDTIRKLNTFSVTENTIDSTIVKQNNRTYTPRVLNDLFQ